MANIFYSTMNSIGDWLASKIAGYINDDMGRAGVILRNYYQGNHRPQLKKTEGKPDDNIYQNFVGLAVDRSVSRLYKGGLKFKLPEGREQQQTYLDRLWDLNKKEILLYQDALHGAYMGTHYFKIAPDAIVDPYTGDPYPRLIALDPEIVRIKTDPQDMNEVLLYQIRYTVGQNTYVEITRRADVRYGWAQDGNAIVKPADSVAYNPDNPIQEMLETEQTWYIDSWEQSALYGNQLTQTNSIEWPYPFPPIIHGKNLPSLKSCYGDSDIDDAINIQDKSNFVTSNSAKIVKFHASPTTIATGASAPKRKDETTGKEEIIAIAPEGMMFFPDKDVKVFNLEMQSDLASSRALGLDLRQSIFDISREIDIASIADKIGSLTNFGLHVLYSDALDKNDTKRQLYGDVLIELNRRLLVLKGWTGEDTNPGTLQWGNAIPTNAKEDMETDQIALGMGIVDKGTVASRYESRYGKTWEEIQAALQEEATNSNQNNADIGSQILRNFNRGGGVPMTPAVPAQNRQPVNNNVP